MTTLTRDVRDRAVTALRKAHADGRIKSEGYPVNPRTGGVCSCVVVAEAFGIPAVVDDGAVPYRSDTLYYDISALGFATSSGFPVLVRFNDAHLGSRLPTFADVADMVDALDVVDEAEAICRDAVLVSA